MAWTGAATFSKVPPIPIVPAVLSIVHERASVEVAWADAAKA